MQNLSLEKQVLIALSEIYDKRRFCAISFAFISLAIIALGLSWPKVYESSTTLIWNKAQVVKPLLEGTAVASSANDHSQIAKEVIYSNKNLERLIQMIELNKDENGKLMSDREIEILKSELRRKIEIERKGSDILNISYKSYSPEEAYLVVSTASKLFMEETTQNKRTENYTAYNFIENQVNEYKAKLDEINESINEFKKNNVQIQADSSRDVSGRVASLREQILSTSLELKEARIRRDALAEQLAIEARKSNEQEVATVKNDRLVELEARLNTLRLSYTDTYPDIVQLKEQIRYLREDLSQRVMTDKEAAGDTEKRAQSGLTRSPLYDRIKQQIADQQTLIRTLEARKLDQEGRFADELARTTEVNLALSKLEELSRDQAVTKRLYDQLLTKRENARVSLNLELESAGSIFKVQEPAVIPLVPTGLRFLHFLIGAIFLGVAIPIGTIVGLLLIDPRVRHEDGFDLPDGIPVIGKIPKFRTKLDTRKQTFVTVQSILIISLTLITMVMLSLSRYYEVI